MPSQSAGGYPFQIENGLIHQFNFTVERQIHDVGVRLSYIGSRSNGLHYTLSTNKPQPSLTPFTASRRPYSQFVSTTFLQQDGKAKYDSVQIELRRKVGFLVVDGHYTLANNFGDYFNLENPYDQHFWNRDQYTSRHRAVINSVVDMPFGRGRRFMTNAPAPVDFALGGWRLTWITTLQSGQYFTPTFTGSDPSNTNSSGGIPDRIGEGNLPSGSANGRWLVRSGSIRCATAWPFRQLRSEHPRRARNQPAESCRDQGVQSIGALQSGVPDVDPGPL